MSTERGVPTPLCQGFLKKRKDKLKLRWVTYWFRLYNTTLFFYTKKHGSALDLRGHYYIYEVQSVREVSGPENKRYLFEITMKNGKKKMLAADSANVRQVWMNQLWKAMLLNGPDRTRRVTNGEQVSPASRSSLCESSYTETSSTAMDSRCLSFDQESFQSFAGADDTQSPQTNSKMEQSSEEDVLPDFACDILPPSKSTEEAVYDTPPSKWPASEGEHVVTDSIYDVPNSIIRKMTDHTIEFHSSSGRPESGGLLSDMIACLGSESATWVKTAPL
ncbi:interactor protein for cytohesin exchange factors 1 [Xyrauchen texanus]|uniref:interactor protein for cytohesin exchange factors 1 n=1 Tax=Xyrauchen texanus TaxID=154827 RepID=UPI002241AEAE|nr:interactor protein for cytohesin exchange factors 1 [Xyrauchen texanus]